MDVQAALTPEDLVFLDETSTQTTLTRTHGRAPAGQRLVAAIPRNHGLNITCLAALSVTGVGPSIVFEGALKGTLFAQRVREYLVPTLRPGQIVILDNLSVHKRSEAREAIEAAANGAIRTDDPGDPLIPGAMHQGRDHLIKHDPIGNATALTP